MAWIQLNSTELLKSSHRVMTTTSCCFVLASLMFRLLCSIAVMVLSPNRRLPTLLGLGRNPHPLRPIWRPKLPHQIIWSRHQSHDEIPNPRYVNKRIPWPIQEIVLIGHGNVGINNVSDRDVACRGVNCAEVRHCLRPWRCRCPVLSACFEIETVCT